MGARGGTAPEPRGPVRSGEAPYGPVRPGKAPCGSERFGTARCLCWAGVRAGGERECDGAGARVGQARSCPECAWLRVHPPWLYPRCCVHLHAPLCLAHPRVLCSGGRRGLPGAPRGLGSASLLPSPWGSTSVTNAWGPPSQNLSHGEYPLRCSTLALGDTMVGTPRALTSLQRGLCCLSHAALTPQDEFGPCLHPPHRAHKFIPNPVPNLPGPRGTCGSPQPVLEIWTELWSLSN